MIDAYVDALNAYKEYVTYEVLPRAGGYRDQETWWLEAIACVKAARRDADREKKAREAGSMRDPSEKAPGQEWQVGTDRVKASELGAY